MFLILEISTAISFNICLGYPFFVSEFGEEADFEIPDDIEEDYRAIFLSVKFWLNDVRNDIKVTNPIS